MPKLIFHRCPEVKTMLHERRQDFDYRVSIEFQDRSKAVFEYAFAELNKEKTILSVYSEHCGYHAFVTASIVSVRHQRYGKKFQPPYPNFKKQSIQLPKRKRK